MHKHSHGLMHPHTPFTGEQQAPVLQSMDGHDGRLAACKMASYNCRASSDDAAAASQQNHQPGVPASSSGLPNMSDGYIPDGWGPRKSTAAAAATATVSTSTATSATAGPREINASSAARAAALQAMQHLEDTLAARLPMLAIPQCECSSNGGGTQPARSSTSGSTPAATAMTEAAPGAKARLARHPRCYSCSCH